MFESFAGSNEEQQRAFEEFEFMLVKKNLLSITNQELNLGSKLNLTVKFDPNCKLKGARAFQVLTTLEDVSKILESKPTRHQIEEGDSFEDLHIVVVTQEDENSIKSRIENVDEVSGVLVETLYVTPLAHQ